MSEKKKTHVMNHQQLQRHRFLIVRRLLTRLISGETVPQRTLYRVRQIIDDWASDEMLIDEQTDYKARKGKYFDFQTMRWVKIKDTKSN